MIIDLYFLIPAVVVQISNHTVEQAMPTGTQTNEANAKVETQPGTVETKISKFST